MDCFIKDIGKSLNKYIVELKRKHVSADIVKGIVLDLSENLILLAVLDDNFYLNGYTIVKVQDVTDYCIYDNSEYFLFKVRKCLNLTPEYSFCLDLNCIKSVCRDIHKYYPLVTVFKAGSENSAFIGIITKLTEQTLSLYEIDSNAEWDKEYRFYLEKISRLDWGGSYENALWQVGKKSIPKQFCNFVNSSLLV